MEACGEEETKDGRTEQNAGCHFTHDGCLAEAGKERSDQLRNANDDEKLQEKPAQRIRKDSTQAIELRLVRHGDRRMVHGCRNAERSRKGRALAEDPPDADRGEYEGEDVDQSESLHGAAG
jgi:hypothetical protein